MVTHSVHTHAKTMDQKYFRSTYISSPINAIFVLSHAAPCAIMGLLRVLSLFLCFCIQSDIANEKSFCHALAGVELEDVRPNTTQIEPRLQLPW